MRKPAAMFWSGGKDSALALFTVQNLCVDFEVVRLITTTNSELRRISMHGVREELLDKQAASIGLPLQKMYMPNIPDNSVYETELHRTLAVLKENGIEHVVFGDIFLEDLKKYRDDALASHGLSGIYPLWNKPTGPLILDFLSAGFRTITCCISTKYLGQSWVGREINMEFIESLPVQVDPCGENGEFHTFCFDGPIFREPISFDIGEKNYQPLLVRQDNLEHEDVGFWFIDLLPKVLLS